MYNIITFVIAQVLTVITSTVKSIATIKSTPMIAGVINSVAYTLNALIVKLITGQDLIVVLIVTFFSNLIGVPLAKKIMDSLEKERLWVYVATIKCNNINKIKNTIKQDNIDFIYQEIKPNKLYEIKFYAYSKDESKTIKNIIDSLDCKYHIIEPI